MQRKIDPVLPTVKETAAYLHLSETKVRVLLKNKECPFAIRVDYRWYANKMLLDRWLNKMTGTGQKVVID